MENAELKREEFYPKMGDAAGQEGGEVETRGRNAK